MIKVAFSGTGWAAKVHAQAVQSCETATGVAVINHKPESRAKFAETFGIPRQYESVEDMLKDGDVDALIVSTPNYLHAKETIAALAAGVHVMVEKPMAMNAAEASEMVHASEVSGSLLMVAHCFRFDPDLIWLRNQVSEGKLGKIIRSRGSGVHVTWGPKNWFVDKDLAGGGALVDMGIHGIDTVRYLLGDPMPVSVYAHIGTYYSNDSVDDTGTLTITWSDGSSSFVESGWWQPHADGPCAAAQLYGTEGFGQAFPTYIKIARPEQREFAIERAPEIDRPGQPPQEVYDTQIKYFINCISNGLKPNPGGEAGLISMKILDAAYKSAQSGEVVWLS